MDGVGHLVLLIFLNPWCYLVNQPTLLPLFSRTIVIKDASSTQCAMEVNNRSKTAGHADYPGDFVLLLQILQKAFSSLSFQLVQYVTPTDGVIVHTSEGGNPAFFCSSWEPTFWVQSKYIFGRNAPSMQI